jgi:hypothetical protein
MNDYTLGAFVIPTWAMAHVIRGAAEKMVMMKRPDGPRTEALRLARRKPDGATAEAKWGEG